MNLRVAAPAGAQGTISGAILAARTPLSALRSPPVFAAHAQVASPLREALRALSHRPAPR